jgi:hypothetical protein
MQSIYKDVNPPNNSMHDSCLELSKIDALKMLDLQTKSAIDSDNFQV